MLFMDEGPFAQGMGIAPSVLAWVAEVRFPKVVDRAPEEAGVDVEGIDGLRAAISRGCLRVRSGRTMSRALMASVPRLG